MSRGFNRLSTQRSATSQRKAFRWAQKAGFTEAQQPWAALCAANMKVGRHGGPVFARDVQARLGAEHPHLFDSPHQLQMGLEL